MELKEGMYVRFDYHRVTVPIQIGKITEVHYDEDEKYYFYLTDKGLVIGKDNLVKEPSYNIIDLIKHKDIILGNDGKLYQCWKVYKDYVFTYSKNKQGQTITLVDYQIDKVLCYEQFESMSYKVGGNE